MGDIAIKFENISKQYRLGTIGTGTLSHDLKRWWTVNIRRKEDPYVKIGQENVLSGMRYAVSGSGEIEDHAPRTAHRAPDYVWALNNINLEVKQGEVLGIIGKNGAGKSTLLKILSRVTAPTTGIIQAKGRIASLLEVGTGFHPEMTGSENIFMNGSIMGMTKVEIKRKFDEIVDFAGIDTYIDTPVKRYSSGMTVRLGFAIAAHLEPEILVVDEVLAVGDAEFQRKAIGKMQDVSHKDGRTVLFVSHNMSAVLSLCTSGIVLHNGNISFSSHKIIDVINNYLEFNVDDNKSSEWINPGNKFRNEYFTPMCIRLLNGDGDKLKNPKLNSIDTILEIEFEVKTLDKAMMFSYRLYNSSLNVLFESTPFDVEYEKWPLISIGKNRFMTRIPSHFLNEGIYHIKILSALHNRQWILDPSQDTPKVSFEIKGGLSNSLYWYEKRPCELAPIFEWSKL